VVSCCLAASAEGHPKTTSGPRCRERDTGGRKRLQDLQTVPYRAPRPGCDSITGYTKHGLEQIAGARGVDVQHVLENGDLYYQDDGQLVRVLDNGNGTSDVVIRDASNPSGGPTTTVRLSNSDVQQRIQSGRWH
jgi:hypothetical protein